MAEFRHETARLILRDWRAEDWAQFWAATNTPAVMRWLGGVCDDAKRDAAGMGPTRAAHQVRVAHRDGAENDPRHAGIEPGFDGRHVADAAAQLQRDRYRRENPAHRRGVHRLTFESTI